MAPLSQLLLKFLFFLLLSLFFFLVVEDAVLDHLDTEFSLRFLIKSSSRLLLSSRQRVADWCLIVIIHRSVTCRDCPPMQRWCFKTIQVRQCKLLRISRLSWLTRGIRYIVLDSICLLESGCTFIYYSVILCLSSPGSASRTPLALSTARRARFCGFLLILFSMDLDSEVS